MNWSQPHKFAVRELVAPAQVRGSWFVVRGLRFAVRRWRGDVSAHRTCVSFRGLRCDRGLARAPDRSLAPSVRCACRRWWPIPKVGLYRPWAFTRRAWPHTPSISGKKFPMDLHTDPQQRIALATMSAQYNCPRRAGL
jgi:hypothetical protein